MYFKHGLTKTREYKSWRSMKDRCLNQNNPDFHHYGGRGIQVCNEWLDSFETFLEDMGPRPLDCTLDRIDASKGYSKDNCRWAPSLTQSRNRSTVKLITWNGESKTIREWANQLGISDITLRKRLRNWPIEKAMSAQLDKSKSRY